MMEPLKKTEKPSEKQEFWKSQIEGWKSSELSQAGYCLQHGLKLSTFHYWRKRLKGPDQGKLRLVPLVGSLSVGEGRRSSGTLRLCRGGFTIELEEDFNPVTLRRLIEILR